MATINDRFRQVREVIGVSQEEFAAKANRTRSEIKNIEYGKTVPKPEVVSSVCFVWDINEIWLRTGEGEMFRELSVDEELSAFFGDIIHDQSDDFKRRFFSVLSKLPESDWEILLNLAESLAKRKD